MRLIDKAAVVAEIEKLIKSFKVISAASPSRDTTLENIAKAALCKQILSFIDTLEVIDPYEQCIQYASIEAGIKAHAEIYSFNIESELFNQLTKEQQMLWRKEIEQACISGGDMGYSLAKDPRYKENLEVKEVDLEKEIQNHIKECLDIKFPTTNLELIKKDVTYTAKKFFELGFKAAQKGE